MKNKILLSIFIVCLLASIALTIIPISETCSIDSSISKCSKVQNSKYAKTFGIHNHYFGIVGFAILIILTISQMRNPKKLKENLIDVGVLISATIAVYFIYLQIYIIKGFCKYCLTVDIASILALILIIHYKFKK